MHALKFNGDPNYYTRTRRASFSSVRVFGGHIRGVFLNTWVGRGKSREVVRHTHGCARCEYVARKPRLGVSGLIYFNMNISFGGGK